MILSMIWSKLLLPVNNRSLYFEKHYRSAVMLFLLPKKVGIFIGFGNACIFQVWLPYL